MYPAVQEEKEIILHITQELVDLKRFLMGDIPNEEKDECSEPTPCLTNDIKVNLRNLKYALDQLNMIVEIMKGGKN